MHIHDKPNSNYIRQTILMVCLCFLMGTSMAQSVGIGTTTPNGSALLDISSNNKGLLIPRMTTAQRDAIASPAMGLQIINTDDMCIDRFDGANWIKTCGAKQIGTVTVSPDLTVQKGNLPRPSINAVAFVIGNKAYYTTGQASFVNGQLVQGNQLWEWDGASQQWSRKADFPVAGSRSYATGFAIGTKGYVGLGWDGTFYKDWWEYDPVNNTWTRRADYPGEGSDGCYAFVIGSKGYVGTGRGPSGDVPVDFWEYDPVFNTWTRRANMPTSVPTVSGWGGYFRGVSFAIGGKGYGALGYNSYLGCAFCSRVTQLLEYDPLANTWIRKADFPMPTGLSFNSLVEGASFVIGSNAYVGAMADDNAIWRYTPASNTWTKVVNLDGPPFSKAVGFAIGTSGYIAGSDFPHLKLWEYRTEPTQVPVFNMASAPLASQVNDGIWTRSGQTIYTSTVGNVGINDNAPAAKLSIAGNVKIADGSQGAGKVLTSDASGVANWQSLPPIPTQFWAANGNNISATNSGNVGIGTASPNGRLQFNNHINNRIVVLNESGSNEHNFFGFGINNFTLRYQIADAFQSHVFFAGNTQNNATGSNELFRIRGNGNVGIRQSNPNAPLQFSNDVANRKIVLFEAANNDHQYFGLGVNNGTFRYQMPVTTDAHVFFAGTGTGSSNELMRIQGNGNVGIGQGNPQVPLHFATVLGKKISLYRGPLGDAGFGVFGNELRIHSDYNGADITFGFDDFTNGFTERFRVRGNGNATLAGTLTQNSDARLKKDIAPLHNTLASLLQINGYSYHWKSEAADQSEQIGLLAQELQKVYPQLVKEQDGKLSVNYSGMIPLLLEAVKEQQTEIAELKKLVQQLLRQ